MPANILKFFADKTKKKTSEVEKSWNKAKDIVSKQYPDVKSSDDKYYSIVVGVMKKMLGLSEDGEAAVGNPQEITTGSIGNMGPGPRVMLQKRFDKKTCKNSKKPTIIHDPLFSVEK